MTEEENITITLTFNRSSSPLPSKWADRNSADVNYSATFVKCHCEILKNYSSSVGCEQCHCRLFQTKHIWVKIKIKIMQKH